MSAPLVDDGFADRDVVSALVRRLRARSATRQLRASAHALLDILQEPCEVMSGERASLVEQAVRLARGDEVGGQSSFRVRLSESDAERERELLDGIEAFIQLLDHLEISFRHGLFSGAVCAEDMGLCDCGQSLCREGK